MKLIFSIFCALSIASVSAEESSKFIVGGSDADIKDFPYMAGIFNYEIFPTCGGSIVGPRSVLTVKIFEFLIL